MAAKQETADGPAPAARRDSARSKVAEVAAKLATVDQQLADLASQEQQLDRKTRQAEVNLRTVDITG